MNPITIPHPKDRNLFLAKQVDQESINAISKAIIAINEDDEYITKIYSAHDIEYKPKPIKPLAVPTAVYIPAPVKVAVPAPVTIISTAEPERCNVLYAAPVLS